MISDAGEDVGEQGLGVDVVEPRGLDEGVKDGGTLPPRSEPQNSHALRPRGTQRSARSAALLVMQTLPSERKQVKAGQRRNM